MAFLGRIFLCRKSVRKKLQITLLHYAANRSIIKKMYYAVIRIIKTAKTGWNYEDDSTAGG